MEDYNDEEFEQEQAEASVEEQINETLTFKIDLNYNANAMIKAAIEKTVALKVEKAINSMVEKAVAAQIDMAIAEIVKTGLKTSIKKFDYAGKVIEERSLLDVVTAAMKDVQEQGLAYKLKYKSGYNQYESTLGDIIKNDIYTMVKERLAPQFKVIEEDFKLKSQAALRQFAVAAVDSATAKTLGRLS